MRSAQPSAPGIAEADVLEADPLAPARDGSAASSGAGEPARAGRDGQVLEEVRHVEVVLVHAADGGEDRLERLLPLAERDHVQRHVAERELRPRPRPAPSPRSSRRTRPCRRGEQRVAPAGALHRELPVLAVEALAERSVAIEQHRAEAEELHLLRVLVVGQDVLEVDEPARSRASASCAGGRRAREKRISAIVAGIAATTSASTTQPAEADEQRDVAGEREDVLHELEGLGDQRERPRRGLAARAGELVVELRVLEVAELERERLLEDAPVDVEPEARAEELADQPEPAEHERLERDDPELDEHPAERPGAVAGDDRVHDLLAHVGDRQRDHRRDEGQRAERPASGETRRTTPGPAWPGCAGSSRAGRRAGIV